MYEIDKEPIISGFDAMEKEAMGQTVLDIVGIELSQDQQQDKEEQLWQIINIQKEF